MQAYRIELILERMSVKPTLQITMVYVSFPIHEDVVLTIWSSVAPIH